MVGTLRSRQEKSVSEAKRRPLPRNCAAPRAHSADGWRRGAPWKLPDTPRCAGRLTASHV